ncbi:MAG: carboxypeptidase regulatory-like domain-containing protein [Leadbetterella sp.]|nr:carboxypeptidase regulatory-like domain-containing protein [Leadbetterella sp.]
MLTSAQNVTLRGRITDTDNSPLTGVTVNVNNTGFNAFTDVSGYFVILNLLPGSYTVTVSYPGHETLLKTLTLPAQGIQVENFVLRPVNLNLQELTVTAPKRSGEMEAKSIAVRSVDIKEVVRQSTTLTDVADRLSGVRIRRSGSLGDRSDISVNGVTGTGIRVYIDGVPMEIAYPAYDLSTLPLNI